MNSELKRQSKRIISVARPSIIAAGVIYLIVVYVLGSLASGILGQNVTESGAQAYMNYYMAGDFEKALDAASSFMPSGKAVVINFVIEMMTVVLSAGFTIFLMNSVRGTGAEFANLLDGFGLFLKIIGLNLIVGLLAGILSIFLIVPGVIVALAYSQTLYIMVDHPEQPLFVSMAQSRAMMKGHKWEYFCLILSFIGWYILALIPFARIWTEPYIGTTQVLYYERIKESLT